MVMIYQPLQRESDQRYDMTSGSDESGSPHAIGYCAGWSDVDPYAGKPEEWAQSLSAMFERSQREREPFRQHFHTDGHATADDALACWRGFMVDLCLDFLDTEDVQRRCAVCGDWTQGVACLNGAGSMIPPAPLCPTHQTRELALEHLFPKPQEGK